jgi:hypothetical protein
MNRQLVWAEKYKRRFPKARIIHGTNIADGIEVHNLPSFPCEEDRLVLEVLDEECHEEWMNTIAARQV